MTIIQRIQNKLKKGHFDPHKYGLLASGANVHPDSLIYSYQNLYMHENTGIGGGSVIMNTRAKVVFKKNADSAFGLSIITGNHLRVIGNHFADVTDAMKDELDPEHKLDQDVIVDEDVWIGANVTILSGTHIGRGATIGAGSIVRGNIPPYSMVMGNPAKVVGFNFKPEEIIEHEKKLFSENERLPIDILERNYNKYFLKRLKDIREFCSL